MIRGTPVLVKVSLETMKTLVDHTVRNGVGADTAFCGAAGVRESVT